MKYNTYLVFDTETTGFPDKRIPEHDKGQARCLQLAMLLLDKDFNEIGSFSSLIGLEVDKEIDKGAQNAHGISKEMCDTYGVEADLAIDLFTSMYQIADCIVAHNIKFDKSIIDIESAIRGYKHVWSKPEICTMDETTELCKIPSPKILGKYKWPKLEEAVNILLGEKLENAHDAMADARGCVKLLKHLVSL